MKNVHVLQRWISSLWWVVSSASRLVALAGFLLVSSIPRFVAATGDDAPPWMRDAASASTSSYGGTAPAVVLLDESRVTIDDEGRVVRVNRQVIKIMTNEGRASARADEVYETDTGRVREMRAWLIRPSGEVRRYGKDQIADTILADNDVYNEARKKVIVAADDAEPGAVFGYEATTEERSFFNQFRWYFQERFPVVLSRCTVSFPQGWKVDSVTFNHSKVEPSVAGTTYTWELRELPQIEYESESPPITSLAPQVAINYYPPAGSKLANGTYRSWADVSRWYTQLSDAQAGLDDSLAGKARQLVVNSKTELERIQATGQFVQSINYVSIQIGMGRFRPHPATEVFTKSYGDCKDKANLMRAMLRALNIPSYLMLIRSGDASFVREEWPSPEQFNHCIIAVKVSEGTEAATIVQHPKLGRLLVFDPTDDNTPVGDLPTHEQGSLALLAAGDDGALLRMPVTPPEANRLERQTEVTLGGDGSITAAVRERAQGHSAVEMRREFRGLARPDYIKLIERWVTRGATGAVVSKVEPADHSVEGRFWLDLEFSARSYGQVMQGRLLVFKPVVVSRRESVFLSEQARKYPVVLSAHAYTETARIKLPDGFEVDELPDPVKLETPFGRYSTSYEVKDRQLQFTRSLIVKDATIPVADYLKVRNFFGAIRAAEQAPVVLARK